MIQKMDSSRIDLNLLRTLDMLLAERNVTRAAEKLCLSQPAVSAQLARLREIFGDPLLSPARRGMIPTARALELVGPLRQKLSELDDLLHIGERFCPAQAQMTIDIACSDFLQAAVLAPLILALRREAPGIRLALRHLDPAEMAGLLSSGAIDLALGAPAPAAPQLHNRPLFVETYVLIGRRGHPGLKNPLTLEDYLKLDHVVVSRRGGDFWTPVDAALAALGVKRRVALSAASFLFVLDIVAASDLVALVPRRLLRGREENFEAVETPWLTERFFVALNWHDSRHGHPGHVFVREKILGLVGD